MPAVLRPGKIKCCLSLYDARMLTGRLQVVVEGKPMMVRQRPLGQMQRHPLVVRGLALEGNGGALRVRWRTWRSSRRSSAAACACWTETQRLGRKSKIGLIGHCRELYFWYFK